MPEHQITDDSKIFRWLVNTYRKQLRLPTLQTRLCGQIEQYSHVNHEIVRKLHVGEVSKHTDETYRQLSEYFRKADRRLPENCFQLSYIEFLERVSSWALQSEQTDTFFFKLNGYDRRVENAEVDFSGTYVCYRYAFEMEHIILVSREVLHVYRSGHDLEFLMSFRSRLNVRDQKAFTFMGKVIPVGSSFCFFGLNAGDIDYDRVRCLLLHNQNFPGLRGSRFGILSSTRLRGTLEPCAASTILIKTQEPVADIEQFIQAATRNESWEEIITQDFGEDKQHDDKYTRHDWIRAFLDNRLAGTHTDNKLAEMENYPEPLKAAETTLKLNLDRFEKKMPGILEAVLANSNISAPFKRGWRPARRAV
jgi:hypothetical protein